jgi:hypothetical protein
MKIQNNREFLVLNTKNGKPEIRKFGKIEGMMD